MKNRTAIFLFFLFSLPVFSETAAAVVKCGITGVDGREIGCPDDTKCVFNNIRNAVNCRCKSKERNPLTKQFDALTACAPIEEYYGPEKKKKLPSKVEAVPGAPEAAKTKPGRPAGPSALEKLQALKTMVKNGDGHFQKGNFDGAIEEWEKAIAAEPVLEPRLNPFLARAYAKRGATQYMKGEYKGALLDFNVSLGLNPNAVQVRKAKMQTEQALAKLQPQTPDPGLALSSGQPPQQEFVRESPQIPPEAEKERKKNLYRMILMLAGILIAGSCVWVGFDASELMQDIPPAERKAISNLFPGPAEWVIASVFFWPLVFPLYLIKRGKYAASSFSRSSVTGKKSKISRRCSEPGKKVSAPQPEKPAPEPPPPNRPEPEPQVSVPSPYAPPMTLTDEAVYAMKKGKYEQARDYLGGKKKPDLFDYNLFLEIYVRLEDFTRAKLIATRINEWLKANPRSKCDYKLCFSMADICKSGNEEELAHKLRETALDGMMKQATVRELAKDYYELGVQFENEGERELALKIYQLFEGLERPYRDVRERNKNLKEKPAAPPPPKKQPELNSVFTRSGVHAAGFLLAGRYEIKGAVGEGGMGVVYEAWDRQGNRKSAIKRMHSQLKQYPEEYERFKREAKIMERLKHPNIVGVQGILEEGGETYLIFDYVEGRSLSEILKERKRFPLNECRDIFKGVCGAVHHAHANNVIHRDLKPSNVMLDPKGQAMVMDFGLASELRESLTRVTHQTMSGTPAYMAPEQHEGIVKKESDIYAMGVCLYEMLTGELPFNSFDFQKQKKNKNYQEVSARLPWLPGGVDDIIDRSLDPEPSMRYGDALDFYEDLKKL
ncbi:MAG: hypothetical protein COT17_05180 [Elusimicrobia bacterium CG08_land_8_20_14_0_20_51_18]|nr:MAG: hypothetical protein COT17_05180 [Elusimicrobia bacterium CG08_land_8_20_14_0_20_51_18]